MSIKITPITCYLKDYRWLQYEFLVEPSASKREQSPELHIICSSGPGRAPALAMQFEWAHQVHSGGSALCCRRERSLDMLPTNYSDIVPAAVDFARSDLCPYCAARALEILFPG